MQKVCYNIINYIYNRVYTLLRSAVSAERNRIPSPSQILRQAFGNTRKSKGYQS